MKSYLFSGINKSPCFWILRFLAIGLLVFYSTTGSAQQVRYQEPVKGWGASSYLIFTDLQEAVAYKCSESKDIKGARPARMPGKTEEHGSGPWKIRFWCISPSASAGEKPWEEESGLIFWRESCQQGYRAVWGKGGSMWEDREIAYCESTSNYARGQPEVCCETAGNPILVSSRRKIQYETDYRGSGQYPLEFTRIYSSGRPGYPGFSSTEKAVKYWRHGYDKQLFLVLKRV